MSLAPRPSAEGSPDSRGTAARRVAALVCAAEAAALAAFCAFYVLGVVRGEEDDAARALMSALLIAVFAVALALFAGQWLRASPWARTPTIVWNLLLLPVAWGLLQSGRPGIAVVVGAAALAGIVAAALAGDTHDLPAGRDEGPGAP